MVDYASNIRIHTPKRETKIINGVEFERFGPMQPYCSHEHPCDICLNEKCVMYATWEDQEIIICADCYRDLSKPY